MSSKKAKKEVETDVTKLKGFAKIQNQQIKHILITPTYKCAVACYAIFALILGGFGGIIYTYAIENDDLLVRYDDICLNKDPCYVTLTPEEDLINPKFYYQLENFFANHRNFVKSRSYQQLRGEIIDRDEVESKCEPVVNISSLGEFNPGKSIDGTPFDGSEIANPCGLIAKYQFNDRYKLYDGMKTSDGRIFIDETNIAHRVDREYKFKRPEGDAGKLLWKDVEDEHLMVWYQMETFPTFVKLWGHVEGTLKAGQDYLVEVENNFNVTKFNGKKYIYISEVNAFGGASKFLAYIFFAYGGLCVVLILVYTVFYFLKVKGKDIYSTENLKW